MVAAHRASGTCCHAGAPSVGGVGHGSAALARLDWASAGQADSPPRSSCCPVKFLFFSEIPNSAPGKNKWERSRCLALGRMAAGAQPRLSVGNTNPRVGPVCTHQLMKANSKNSPSKNPQTQGFGRESSLLLRAQAKLKRWENQNETFPGEELAPARLLPSSRHRCCLLPQPSRVTVGHGSPAGPRPRRALGSSAKTTSAPRGADSKRWTWVSLSPTFKRSGVMKDVAVWERSVVPRGGEHTPTPQHSRAGWQQPCRELGVPPPKCQKQRVRPGCSHTPNQGVLGVTPSTAPLGHGGRRRGQRHPHGSGLASACVASVC